MGVLTRWLAVYFLLWRRSERSGVLFNKRLSTHWQCTAQRGTTYKNGRWQPMGSSSPALSNMQFLVLLSAVALAFASPIPDGDEAPAALPYVHDATGDVAVDDSPAALPYVHDATGDVADDASPAAEPYVHDEPVVVAPVAVAAPAVTYAAYPYTYGAYPYHHAYPYAVAAYHTGCVNNVGSVVPCA